MTEPCPTEPLRIPIKNSIIPLEYLVRMVALKLKETNDGNEEQPSIPPPHNDDPENRRVPK